MSAPNRDLREIVREEPVMRGRILELLAVSPLSIPEIATSMACPTHEVMFWVMAMRRYGHLREVKGVGSDGYFRYETIVKDAS